MAVGSRASAADYNAVRSVIFNLMGVGSGTTGYGQAVASNTVTVGSVISVAQWNNLENDLKKARQHQTGTSVTNGTASGSLMTQLQTVTSSTVISEAIRVQYQSFADAINGPTERVKAAANQLLAGQVTTTTNRATGTNWGGAGLSASVTQTITVTFGGYTQGSLTVANTDHIRCFFNAGGSIQITSNRTGTAANTKDTNWTSMLTGFNTFTMGASGSSVNGTINTGGSVASSIGYHQLTGTNQTLFTQAATSVYVENRFTIQARVSANVITFTLTWTDNDAGDRPVPSPPPPFGPLIDEPVTGTLSSTISITKPDGSNVTVPNPSISAGSISI